MITKPEILKADIDWVGVKNACRTTVGKDETDNEPTSQFKRKLMISEHSPIRKITINWVWRKIYSWVATHFARHHEGWEKFISTQRPDRTGVDRNKLPQDALVRMEVEANPQALINVGRVRLCYQASPETRECMEQLKMQVTDLDSAIGDVMVPNCIYRDGCPEFEMCKEQFFPKFKSFCITNNLETNTIQKRYDAYNRYFRHLHDLNEWKGEN